MTPHKRGHRRGLRSPYVWHRWLGVTCALLVLWLCATGIALNHTHALGLERAQFSQPWLLRVYGMRPEPPRDGFAVAGNWITQAGGKLFFNAVEVTDWHGQLHGIAFSDGLILVAGTQESVLLTPEGQLVERLRERRPGDGVSGLRTQPETVPETLREQILMQGGGLELSGARVLADLHSGRLFGRYGPLVMDLAAGVFIALALTGLWLWWRFQQAQRLRERRQRAHHS